MGRVRPEGTAANGRETRLDGGFVAVAVVAVVLALVPWPGRWKVLQQALPVLLVLGFYRLRRYTLAGAGFGRPSGGWGRCVAAALVAVAALLVLRIWLIRPLLQSVFEHEKDLSLFAAMRGDLATLIVFLVGMWLFAAIGEEVLWRGFLLRELGERWSFRGRWVVAVLVSAVLFGVAHAYQGAYGVAEKILGASLFGTLYVVYGRRSVWLVVLVHGTLNTIAFIRIYLGHGAG